MRLSIFLLATFLLAAGCTDTADQESAPAASDTTSLPGAADAPQDLAALESPHVDTRLRNEFVDVHHVTLPAGAALAPHQGGARVVYSLGSYTLRFEADGAPETNSFAEGDVHYHDGGVHAVENTGSEDAAFVVFERRDAPLPDAQAQGETEIQAPSEGASDEVLFDNDVAEVHRVMLEPGAQLPPHQGYARAVYALNDYLLEFTSEGSTREQRFEAGEAHYHDPGDHTVQNAGDTAAEFLVTEFKQ